MRATMCIAEDEERMLMGSMILSVVYTSGQMLEKRPKTPFPPFLGTFGAASRRDGSLSKSLRHYEI
jgi:hypothetical protein